MDIITSNHVQSIDKHPIFNDVIQTPYKSPTTPDKDFYLKTNADSDALLAVKMDPAVLEAQVTVTSQPRDKPPSSPADKLTKDNTKQKKDVMASSIFEAAVSMQQAALFSLTPEQFQLLLRYVDTLRRQRQTIMKQMECAFCKNNGHPEVWYTTHALRDARGRVRCPVLRAHYCRRCGATGDAAHTLRYCPLNFCELVIEYTEQRVCNITHDVDKAAFAPRVPVWELLRRQNVIVMHKLSIAVP